MTPAMMAALQQYSSPSLTNPSTLRPDVPVPPVPTHASISGNLNASANITSASGNVVNNTPTPVPTDTRPPTSDIRPHTADTRPTTADTRPQTADTRPPADARPQTADTRSPADARPHTADTRPHTADTRPQTTDTRPQTATSRPQTGAELRPRPPVHARKHSHTQVLMSSRPLSAPSNIQSPPPAQAQSPPATNVHSPPPTFNIQSPPANAQSPPTNAHSPTPNVNAQSPPPTIIQSPPTTPQSPPTEPQDPMNLSVGITKRPITKSASFDKNMNEADSKDNPLTTSDDRADASQEAPPGKEKRGSFRGTLKRNKAQLALDPAHSPRPHPPLEREQSRTWFVKYSTMRAYVPREGREKGEPPEDPNGQDKALSPQPQLQPQSPIPGSPDEATPPALPAYIDRLWSPLLRHHRKSLPSMNFADTYKPDLMYIIKEIIETEADYLDDIGMFDVTFELYNLIIVTDVMVRLYKDTLLLANVLTIEDLATIFGNITEIYTLHVKFMEDIAKDIISVINSGSTDCPPIAALFVKMIAPWEKYTPYLISSTKQGGGEKEKEKRTKEQKKDYDMA
jgi:hypothetical protein